MSAWERRRGYDRKKYAAMLREAFEPFVLCVPKRAEPVLLSDSISEDDVKRFPLFSALTITPLKECQTHYAAQSDPANEKH